MRKYLAEFLGTFTLVFIGTSVATLQGFLKYGDANWLMISAAFGGTLAVMVMVVGPVSGCHLNPAVTIPMAASGRLPWGDAVPYIVSQLLGATAASGVLYALVSGIPNYNLAEHGLGANGNPRGMTVGSLFGWELLLTGLFVYTIFSSTRKGASGEFAAIAIGGFLFLAHLVGAPLGDSSLNPARSFGPAIVQQGEALKVLWIFIVAPIIGGILGCILHWVIYANPE